MPQPSSGAIARVSANDCYNTAAASTVSVTLPQLPGQGNVLIACVWINKIQSAADTVQDQHGNSWFQPRITGVSTLSCEVYLQVALGTETTITFTQGAGTATEVGIAVFEYFGVRQFNSLILPISNGTTVSSAITTYNFSSRAALSPQRSDGLTFSVLCLGNSYSASSWANSTNLLADLISGTGVANMIMGEWIGEPLADSGDTATWTTGRGAAGVQVWFYPYTQDIPTSSATTKKKLQRYRVRYPRHIDRPIPVQPAPVPVLRPRRPSIKPIQPRARFTVIPSQTVTPKFPFQLRQAKRRFGMVRRSRKYEPPWTQTTPTPPAYPPAPTNSKHTVRGWLVQRGKQWIGWFFNQGPTPPSGPQPTFQAQMPQINYDVDGGRVSWQAGQPYVDVN